MIQTILIVFSLVIFVIGFVVMIYTAKKEYGFSNKVIARLIFFVGSALFPLYVIGYYKAPGGVFDMAVSSFLGIVRVLTGENSLGDTREVIGVLPSEMTIFVANYTAFLHLLLVLLVMGFVLSFFKNHLSKFNYRFVERGKLFIFTEASERSLLLAEDIRRQEKYDKTKKCAIVFLQNMNETTCLPDGYEERLNKMSAHLFDLDVCDLPIYKRYLKHTVCFFLLKTNEEENLKQALILAQKYGQSDFAGHLQIHILNSSQEAAAVVDTIEYSTVMSFRIFNETRALLYDLFDRNPLFLAKQSDVLKILVVGGGKIGTEAVKLASWCAQTLKLRPEIVVVDCDAAWQKRFEAQCPELAVKDAKSQKNEDVNISFYHQDVRNSDFLQTLKAHHDVGYVLCALGDEELNLSTAMYIRSAYEGIRFNKAENGNVVNKPQIHLLLNNPFLSEISSKILFNAKIDSELVPFGSLQNLYTLDNVSATYLDHLGMAVNRFYARYYAGNVGADELAKAENEADKQYDDKEYNRTSSMALGLHAKYKLYAALCEMENKVFSKDEWSEKPSDEMLDEMKVFLSKEENVEALSILEHRRWNTYMRTQGWQYAELSLADAWYGIEKNDHRNFAAKYTTCLVSWEELKNVDEWLLKKHGKTSDLQELDRVMVRDLDVILRQAKNI